MRPFLFFIASLFCLEAVSQKATVQGQIKNLDGNPMEAVTVAIIGTSGGTSSDKSGNYSLEVEAGIEQTLVFTHIGFIQKKFLLNLKPGQIKALDVSMEVETKEIDPFTLEDQETRKSTFTRIDPKVISKLPSVSGNIEAILFTMPGVTSNNELSSQYSVRGGNFDENLVYVNDVQVYRPFLVRSGQQEGLSFVNSDMVSDIRFSAGGFEARYGDKMSSVLDITYKKPVRFGGGVTVGLLGGTAYIEDATDNHRFTQIHGIRYRSNSYVLSGLDVQGDYKPSFFDYQSYLTYDINDEVELSLLTNVSRNRYRFVPETRETDFGTVNEALRLTVFFQGNEIDQYQTGMGALTLKYQPKQSLMMKFIASAYVTEEQETFDIEGAYRLDELERDLSSQEFGDVKFNRGVGGFIDHARNYLSAYVFSGEHLGNWYMKQSTIRWGLKYQHEDILDELSEWYYVDSAGYSVPHGPGITGFYFYDNDSNQINPIPISPRSEIGLKEVIKANNSTISDRVMGFAQWDHVFDIGESELSLIAGARFNYWTFNNEITLSPRASMVFKPNWKTDILFRAAWGYYHQPAFYREMRDLFGNINANIRAQQSVHYVFGTDLNFKLWNRPFKFTGELYYKYLNFLIPYEIDNVRLRYYATNNSSGYAQGIDLKLNGEFVKGIDSWASLSVMEVREDLNDDFYYEFYNAEGEKIIPGFTFDDVAVDSTRFEPGFIPRPTDQRVNFGLFFQDYLPKFPSYQMQLNLLFGSGLPFGPPTYDRYRDTLRIPPYRRVDIGFSKQLLDDDRETKDKGPFRHFRSAWLTLEVFNILQINNTISYLWVRDVSDRQYAIPNYLTTRRINLRLVMKF